MLKELDEQRFLVRLVENREDTDIVLWFWGVLKIFNIISNNLPVGDEESLPINDVRDHHHLIELRIWELERRLGCLDIKCHDSQVSCIEFVLKMED